MTHGEITHRLDPQGGRLEGMDPEEGMRSNKTIIHN